MQNFCVVMVGFVFQMCIYELLVSEGGDSGDSGVVFRVPRTSSTRPISNAPSAGIKWSRSSNFSS